ncbi:MAG: tryptophan--tRNA ligase [Acidimicrobiales bacterium]
MARVFSGIQPTGELHLGNYLGAVRRWVPEQREHDSIFCIVDLHALTIPKDPAELRSNTTELVALLMASGLDPEACTLFAQSHVHEHAELGWIMECTASFGELNRMTQFKEKGAQSRFTSAGLFAYPALQAADILLYDTDEVPVGDDQRQHIELARDLAERFNTRYGAGCLVVPKHTIAPFGARVMDLQTPTSKMSKSLASPQGTILVLDSPEVISRKLKRAVTDNEGDVRYDPETKPGVANLLSILAAASGADPMRVAERYTQYGPLKADAAEAVIEVLRPLQSRYVELVADPSVVTKALVVGAEKAQSIAAGTLARVKEAVGLLPRR